MIAFPESYDPILGHNIKRDTTYDREYDLIVEPGITADSMLPMCLKALEVKFRRQIEQLEQKKRQVYDDPVPVDGILGLTVWLNNSS